MQRFNAASCLVFALLAPGALALGPGRVRLEVVQTHTGIKVGSGAWDVLAPTDSINTQCSGTSGVYSRGFGFHCRDTEHMPPSPSMANQEGYALFYDVSVILPDDAHVVLHCSTVLGKGCEGFPNYPDGTSVVCHDFAYAGTQYKDCTAWSAAPEGIGTYEAALHGEKVTIFGNHWQRNYLKNGTWRFADPRQAAAAPAAGQDAKTSNTPAPSLSSTAADAIDPKLIDQAKDGDMVAQYKLGYDYYLGHGIAQDYAQAAIWWRRSADQGFADAQNNLGVLYNSGKGVPQSYSEAYFWQNLAAARANGKLQAQFAKNRDDSASRLSWLERLRVQKRASKWAASHPVSPKLSEQPLDHTEVNQPAGQPDTSHAAEHPDAPH